ncbi:hypothetical protein [Spongiibacter marinus]|uniref:hypothetical protein n=1 Tax=Spongiibacter marinus TaxID=354246 RepID=UPI0004257F79|nr:hypothetical protein [Spongiibacter marinus]
MSESKSFWRSPRGSAVIVAAGLLLIGAGLLLPSGDEPVLTNAADLADLQGPAAPQLVRKAPSESEQEAAFVEDMQQRFAPVIEVKHAQLRVIEQLIAYLKQRYPEDWQQRIAGFLRQLFPEHAEALLAKYFSLMSYNEWLVMERRALQAMSAAERREALWEQRYAAFGADAEQIWAAELRNQKISDALSELGSQPALGARGSAEQFVESLREQFGDDAEALLASRRTELLNRIVELETVQSDLRRQPAERRRQTLRELRQVMGMDEAALDRWQALDQRRDERWQQGELYMREREALVSQYRGEAKEAELAALRERMFGENAAAIAREEQGGFFRYARERRIGRE